MKPLFLLAVLVLGSSGAVAAQAQQTGAPTTTVAPAAPAPLPDEKSLKISDGPGATPTTAQAPSGDITVWDFVKMFVILALVIGMILGFVWFMRKLSGQGKQTDSPIKVLHTQSLGGNRNLQVVEVGDEILLMGVSDSGITLVKDLTGSEVGDSFRLAASQAKSGARGFSDLLSGLMGVKPKIRPDVGQPGENSSDFLKKQRERLKNL